MKGGALPSLLEIFIIIAVLIFTGIFIQLVSSILGVRSQWNMDSPRNIEIAVVFEPILYDSAFMSFYESEYQGIPVKRIISSIAIQQNAKNVWVDRKFIDAEAAFSDVLSILIDKPYLLKIRDPEIIIAGKGILPSYLQKISTKVYLLDGKAVDLELYVGML